MIDETDLLYAAGFLDGEGCFTVTKGHKIVVCCENTYKPVIEWLHSKFGGSLTKNRTQRKSNHRITYRWSVVSRDAVSVCKLLAPYLKEKTEQALLLIALQQTMGLKRPISDYIKEERIYLSNILKGLKHVTW